MKTVTRKLSEITFDVALFPRTRIDLEHVESMRKALRTGKEFPPIVIDEKNRCIDGFHRGAMYEAEGGPDALVTCITKRYANDGAAFLDAVKLNAEHGKTLTRFDRACVIAKGARHRLGLRVMCKTLGVPYSEFKAAAEGRVAVVERTPSPASLPRNNRTVVHDPVVERVPIAKPIAHMAGKTLTPKQEAANKQLIGPSQHQHVDQLLILLRSNLIDTGDKSLMRKLAALASELDQLLASGATNGKSEALAGATA